MEDKFDLTNLISNKKKRKNSRKKGNTFELKIAKLLNDTFKTNEFMRSPGSGAFATTHTLPDHLKISGDLITPKNFAFVIECKKGYNKENLGSIFNEKSDFWGFVRQAERDAKKANKDFMVVFQQDRKSALAILKYSPITELLTGRHNNISVNFFNEKYIICELDILLNVVNEINQQWMFFKGN